MLPVEGFKSYPLTGEALELAKAYAKEIDLNHQEINEIQREAQERATAATEARRAKMRELWVRMAASVGLDPDTTWDSQQWGADVRYLDHGFGAIVYYPPQPNPLAGMFGQEEDSAENADAVPEGASIN